MNIYDICKIFNKHLYIFIWGFSENQCSLGARFSVGDTPQVLNPANHPFQGRFLDGIKDIDLIWITLQPTTLRM